MAEQLKEIRAQNDLIATDDTKANGIFTLTCSAWCLLTEIYQADPSLKT